jgi:hypothetical protein
LSLALFGLSILVYALPGSFVDGLYRASQVFDKGEQSEGATGKGWGAAGLLAEFDAHE